MSWSPPLRRSRGAAEPERCDLRPLQRAPHLHSPRSTISPTPRASKPARTGRRGREWCTFRLQILVQYGLRASSGTGHRHAPSASAACRSERCAASASSARVGLPAELALETFADERVGALPVVDDAERLVGILSYLDLLAWLRENAPGPEGAPRR